MYELFSSHSSLVGGAIFADSVLSLNSSSCIGNAASASGGAVATIQASVTIGNCLFEGNNAYRGGAFDLEGSEASLTNCTFVGSTAVEGSVLSAIPFYDNSNVTLNDCRVNVSNLTSSNGTLVNQIFNNQNSRLVVINSQLGCLSEFDTLALNLLVNISGNGTAVLYPQAPLTNFTHW